MLSYISDEILAEVFMDQVMKDFKKSKILEEISQSLNNNDKATFLRFTGGLKAVFYKEYMK